MQDVFAHPADCLSGATKSDSHELAAKGTDMTLNSHSKVSNNCNYVG